MRAQIYVEIRIRGDLEQLWTRSQDPSEHQRWDLRFTEICYQPRVEGQPQRFTYALRLPGRRIEGVGVSLGEKSRPDGTRTSALKFWSDDPISLIRSGSGYWRYIPTGDGIRFVTGYDYVPGWGAAGAVADVAFRPVMWWMTAWSFDRLRLWIEDDVPPERSRTIALADISARLITGAAAVAMVAQRRPVAAGVTAALALLAPRHRHIPRARRCLHRAPDAAAARPPSTLELLEPS